MRKLRGDLQQLIHSLNPAETRYCLTQLKQVGTIHRPHLLHIFNALHKPDADEEAVKARLLKANPGWDFAHYKKMLTQVVQQSLVTYRSNTTAETRLHYMLEVEKVMFGKNLFSQCSRLLADARTLSAHYNYHLLELEILSRQGSQLAELFPDNFLEVMDEIAERRQQLCKLITCETDYRNLCLHIFLLNRKYHLCRTPELKNELLQLLHHPLLSSKDKALNFRSQRFYHNALAMLYELMGKPEQVLPYMLENYNLWQQNPHQQHEKPAAYRASLGHLCSTYITLNRFAEAKQILQTEQTITVHGSTENARWFREIKLKQLVLCLNTADFEAIPALLNEIKKGLQIYTVSHSYALSLIHNAAICCFVMEDYNEALRWLRRINDYGVKGERQDIRDFSPLFILILWFCAGKHDLIEHNLRNAKRYYTKSNKLYAFESLITLCLPQLLTAPSAAAKQPIAQEFLKQIKHIDQQLLGIPETTLWLQSLAKAQPMKLIIAKG